MKKIAIIGGGISGLFLANLMENDQGFEYKIYEKQKNFIHRVFKQSYESLIAGLSEDESNDFHQMLNELIVPVDAMDDLDRFIEPLT